MKAMIFTSMPMFVCLFWSVLLALELRTDGRNRPRLHLLVFMLTATVLYLGHCAFFNRNTAIIPLTDPFYCAANLAVYPLYFLYILSLTTRSEQHTKLSRLLLLPALFGGTAVGICYALMSPAETEHFIDAYLYHDEYSDMSRLSWAQVFIHDVCKVVFALLIIPAFFFGRNCIQRYEKLVVEIYADTENKTLKPLHYMLDAFVVTSIFSFVANVIGRHQFADSMWLLAIPSTLFSVLLFTIGYIGYRQQFSIEDIEKDEQQADSITTDKNTISELKERIERLMEQEQLYRQPNIKIIDLVQRLNTNRNYIYQAINREMGISFSEYINRMRIEYASMLIAQHPEKSLSEIAEQSGFTSSTSFYRNFKLYKDMGPKEYVNALKG